MDIIDVGLIVSYILTVVGAVAAIVIPLVQAFSDPKALVKSLVGVGAILVVFLVGYVIADPNSKGVSETTSKLIGAGIITTYIFILIALVGIVYTEISKIVK